ncbi:hypothetical protein NEPAR05_0391 [Nematocida parisii]|nr:hypothetical protein NEPAR05_0391 [Nematocida parisii]
MNIKALHRILENNEIDKSNLTEEDIEYLKNSLNILGYKLNNWHDRKTLVITAMQTEEVLLKDYEIIAMDIILEIINNAKDIPVSRFINCAVAKELIENNWLVIDNNRNIQLSKRLIIENTNILSEKANISICSLCGIINNKGNIPHIECNIN